jgi:ComEC/Rec2-related protein
MKCLGAGRKLAAIGLGAALAAVSAKVASLDASPWIGIPAVRVASMSGILEAPPLPTKGGDTILFLIVDRVSGDPAPLSRHRWEGAARLHVALFVPSEPANRIRGMSTGERLAVRARPPGTGDMAFVKAGDIASLGYSSATMGFLAKARKAFRDAVSRIPFSGSGFLTALMTGDRALLSNEESDAFRKSGCLHILALSGQHVGILAALLALVLTRLLGKKASLALSAAIAAAYLLVTGIQPSMLRAVLSFSIACAAWFAGRPLKGAELLGLTFLIAVSIQPSSPAEASFMLSYAATAGIVILAGRIGRHLNRWLPPKAAQALGVSLSACLSSAPVSIAVFGSAAPVSIAVSTLAGPLVTLIMWAGCAFVPLAAIFPWPALHRLLGALLDPPYRLLREVVRAGALVPSFAFPPGPARAAAALVLVLAFLLLYAWRKHGYPGLRLPPRPQGLPRRTRPRHEQALRAELPREPGSPPEDRRRHRD